MEQHANKEDEEDQKKDRFQDQEAKATDAALELVFGWAVRQSLDNIAESRMTARRGDERSTGATDN